MELCKRLNTLWTGKAKICIGVIASVMEMFFFGAYFYGLNSLRGAYSDLGVFENFCNGTDCKEQELMFSYVYILGLCCQLLFSPLTGMLMDRVGLRVAKLLAVNLFTLGSFLFAFTNRNTSYMLFPAAVFLAVGSMASMFCDCYISVWLPKFRGLILALQNGAYDSSAAIAFFVAQTYPQISLQTSFIVIGVCGLVYGTLIAVFFLTQHGNEMELRGELTENTLLEVEFEEDKQPIIKQVDSEVDRIIRQRYPCLKDCFLSWPFALLMIYSPIANLRFSYYNSGLSRQVNDSFKSNNALTEELLEAFSAVAMCAFFISPLNGFIMDMFRKYYRQKVENKLHELSNTPSDEEIYWTHLRTMFPTLMILASLGLLLTIAQFIRGYRWLFYVQFVLDISFQTMQASLKTTNVMIAFPVEHFGTIMGVVCMTGGLSALLQYGFLQAPIEVGNGIMLFLSLAMYIPPFFHLFKRR